MNVEKDQEKENIFRLQQFVLNNKSEDIRNELYEYMVIRSIYDHGKIEKYLNQELIIHHIENDYGVVGMPPSIISDTITRLQKKKIIHMIEKDIQLDSKKSDEIKNNNLVFVELIENIKNELETKIVNTLKISEILSQEIIKDFFKLLGKIFANNGRIASKIIVTNKGTSDLFNNNDFKINYQQTILSKINYDQHKLLDEIFCDFFSNNSKKYSQFFFTLIQSYALLEIFNVDPNLKQIQANALRQKKIYLDTNILIPILFEENENFEILSSILKTTNQLGAKLLITNLTKREFERWLESTRLSYVNFKEIPQKFRDAFKNGRVNAPFFDTYNKRSTDNQRLKINEFCRHYENFLIILKDKFQIEMESEKLESLKEDENYENLLDLILQITPHKGIHVASHDALNILNVKKQRIQQKVDEIGQSSWFLTTDTSLKKIEKKIFPDDEFPASIKARIWFQIITPLMSPRLVENSDGSKAFTKLLSMNFVSSNSISEEDILNIISAFIEDNDIKLDALKAIVGNSHIRETFRNIRQSHYDKNEEEEEEWKKLGMSQITKTLRVSHDIQTVDLKKALKNFSIQLKSQESQMKEQKEIMKTQSKILEKQTIEIKNIQKEKQEKNWSIIFLKKLVLGIIISIGIVIVSIYFNLSSDVSSILNIISIEATILGVIFATWFAIHKTKSPMSSPNNV